MYRTSERAVEPERESVRCEIERTECRPLFSAGTDAQVDPRELRSNDFAPCCHDPLVATVPRLPQSLGCHSPQVAIASLIMRVANSHAYRSIPNGKSGSDSRHSDLRVLMVIGLDRDKSGLPCHK